MSLTYGDITGVALNRKNFLSSLGINYKDLICAKQVHGNSVRYVSEEHKGRGALAYEASIPDTDGFITDIRNLPLAIFTADCLSIFLYDPQKPAIGLVHAGWRSTKAGIIACALELMQSKFKADPGQLLVGFGPCLRSCCYEVSGDFRNNFASGLVERGKRLYLDLAQVNKKQLMDSGAKQENISDSGVCTYCGPQDFFSFRREQEASGRMLSVIMLK